MNEYYPFYFISDFFYQCDKKILNTTKPSFNQLFPQRPQIRNTWEFIFGISRRRFIQYENDKTEFENQRNLYERDVVKYETDLKKETIQFYKTNIEEVKKKYKSFFERNLDLKFIDAELKTGVGERIFRKELLQEFGDSVLINKKIIKVESPYFDEDLIYVEDEEYEIGNPDLLIIINYFDFRIIINIEIDEPYIAESGEIIHYINNQYVEEEDSYIDYRRDSRFSENGIIVLRYSEEQVIKYPRDVVKDITSFIKEILNFKYPYYPFNSETLSTKRWTKNEAIDLSNNNFRNSYLFDNEITSAEKRGFLYKMENLKGTWYEDEDGSILSFYNGHLITDFDVQNKFLVRLRKISESKQQVEYIGSVYLKKDRLKLSFIERNGRFLGKLYGFTWDLQILTLTKEIFNYKEVNKDKVYKTTRI